MKTKTVKTSQYRINNAPVKIPVRQRNLQYEQQILLHSILYDFFIDFLNQ